MMDEQRDDELGSPSSSFSANSGASSSSSDFFDDATSSPPSSSSSSSSSSTTTSGQKNPLFQMSDLMEELPIKRGLSMHFQGKSQSFTSLSNVRCLEDLVKPQQGRPFRKRMKSCKSYGGGLADHSSKPLSPNGCCSRIISKKPPSNHHHHRRHQHHHHHIGFLGGRPPAHPHGSGNLSGHHALLFA